MQNNASDNFLLIYNANLLSIGSENEKAMHECTVIPIPSRLTSPNASQTNLTSPNTIFTLNLTSRFGPRPVPNTSPKTRRWPSNCCQCGAPDMKTQRILRKESGGWPKKRPLAVYETSLGNFTQRQRSATQAGSIPPLGLLRG